MHTTTRQELIDVILPLAKSENRDAQTAAIARKLGISPARIKGTKLRKHSIDARKKDIKVLLRFEVAIDGPLKEESLPSPHYPDVADDAPRVIVVGAGPAGLFAALRLIESGIKPIVIERGKDASSRRFDLAPILRKGTIVEDSNYCFGEGGAGTFSDGKLYTRATKRGPVAQIYETFVAHGAPDRILVDSHPHIGSNLLPSVVMAMRKSIIAAGGEVRFQTKVTGLLCRADRIIGVTDSNQTEILGEAVVLATGHSARDIYRLLRDEQIVLEPKPFAVGVRIEHSQSFIDSQQYHYPRNQTRDEMLPAASYRLATKIKNRGVHSFCMCPGGFIVPAATENDEVVVNGMSLSRRDSPFANSGLVVTVEPEDTNSFQELHGVLAGVAYQKALEISAKDSGGGGQKAPGQLVRDFLENKSSNELIPTSYFPGLTAARIDKILPNAITWRLQQGLKKFAQSMPGYVSDECQLIGFETRTSSPVRIPRNSQTLQNDQLKGLYPCGEGAGFAGGIVSAAMDGLKCADAIKVFLEAK
ncbi:NAD(P)/FAD-dependent oxidoreductase [Synoicihabitans lomoniglobus]|uniref:FAD-binding protein n=1 Tax=Synoicihabitans lomoniglobus TaxID=2909285 RepID=A0AAE9ZYB5_9BACT|nr:FAD-binding protein [Opitutaceae bacterium LMO-M01]WED65275.1 FAD-binding protein [Opitutaceae bacterium LMO-M01]